MNYRIAGFFAVLVVAACQRPPEPAAEEIRTVVRAQPPRKAWDGWGYSAPPAPAHAPAVPQAPAKFTLVPDSRTFSGRVEGLTSAQGVEIGIVSLVGVHWGNPKCYQWEPIAPDGSFSITSDAFPEAAKSLVVRGPEIPWTFLQQDFAPGQGARDIVLTPPRGKKVRLSLGDQNGGPDASHGFFDFFPEARQFDNAGQPLRRQRIGYVRMKDQTSAEVWLPPMPVAVLAGSKGLATTFERIDPRKADHFHFELLPGATMRIQVLDAAGTPKANVPMRWINPSAPLSIGRGTTNAEGILERDSLAAGAMVLNVEGHSEEYLLLAPGQLTELVLREKPAP